MTQLIAPTNTVVETISDQALDRVAGGINPQPLPPREAFVIRSLSSLTAQFAIGQRFLSY